MRRETQTLSVGWNGPIPPPGTSAAVEPLAGALGRVMTPDLQPLGALRTEINRARSEVVGARVNANGDRDVEFFGPFGFGSL